MNFSLFTENECPKGLEPVQTESHVMKYIMGYIMKTGYENSMTLFSCHLEESKRFFLMFLKAIGHFVYFWLPNFVFLYLSLLMLRIVIFDFLVTCSKNKPTRKQPLIRQLCKDGNLSLIKTSTEKTSDTKVFSKLLCFASFDGHLSIVKYAVEKGADIHYQNDYAFRSASGKGYFKIVKFLLFKGANIHANNDTALRRASDRGDIKTTNFLLSHGADINMCSPKLFKRIFDTLKTDIALLKYEKQIMKANHKLNLEEAEKATREKNRVGEIDRLENIILGRPKRKCAPTSFHFSGDECDSDAERNDEKNDPEWN